METGLALVTLLTVFIMVVILSTIVIEDTDQQRVQILRQDVKKLVTGRNREDFVKVGSFDTKCQYHE